MKVLLTGGRGMLGRTLCAELTDFEMIPTDLPEADITDERGIDAVILSRQADCAAGYGDGVALQALVAI